MSDGLKLLSAILENGSIAALRELDDDLMVGDETRVLAQIRAHFRRYRSLPDVGTVETDTGVRIPHHTEPPAYYLHKVQDRKLYEQMRDGYTQLKTCLRDFDMSHAREVVELLRLASRHSGVNQDLQTLGEAADSVVAAYNVSHQNPGISGVPSGWGSFDTITGGYQNADLITFVGRMSMGKTTTLLVQTWAAWLAGYSVLFVTMEMSIEQITRRMLALPTGIDPRLIRRGTLSTYAERRLHEVIESLAGTERFHMFSGGLKKKTSDVELLAEEYRPDIIFVDGVYLMHAAGRKAMTKTERVDAVFDELKQTTLTQNRPIVASTQFNRQAGTKGKDGSMETIAYSDAIGTHSSIVVKIQAHSSDADKRVLGFMKGREGEEGEITINYRFAPPDFSEVIEPVETGEATAVTGNLDWMTQ